MYEYTFTRKRISEAPIKATNSTEVTNACRHIFNGAESERLVVLALDNQNQVIGIEEVYKGSISAALVRVGELFRFPVRVNAASIIVAHNHPSGSLMAGQDDLHLTAEIVAAGKLMDIPLLDHVVVGLWDQHTSLRDQGVVMGR